MTLRTGKVIRGSTFFNFKFSIFMCIESLPLIKLNNNINPITILKNMNKQLGDKGFAIDIRGPNSFNKKPRIIKNAILSPTENKNV